MNINKYTEKAQEAVIAAQQVADEQVQRLVRAITGIIIVAAEQRYAKIGRLHRSAHRPARAKRQSL